MMCNVSLSTKGGTVEISVHDTPPHIFYYLPGKVEERNGVHWKSLKIGHVELTFFLGRYEESEIKD